MISPLNQNVLIKPEPITETKLTNIVFTNPKPATRKGEIISVGKDVEWLKKGDIVVFVPTNTVETDGLFLVDASLTGKILFKYN